MSKAKFWDGRRTVICAICEEKIENQKDAFLVPYDKPLYQNVYIHKECNRGTLVEVYEILNSK